jgi:hypothetical protein
MVYCGTELNQKSLLNGGVIWRAIHTKDAQVEACQNWLYHNRNLIIGKNEIERKKIGGSKIELWKIIDQNKFEYEYLSIGTGEKLLAGWYFAKGPSNYNANGFFLRPSAKLPTSSQFSYIGVISNGKRWHENVNFAKVNFDAGDVSISATLTNAIGVKTIVKTPKPLNYDKDIGLFDGSITIETFRPNIPANEGGYSKTNGHIFGGIGGDGANTIAAVIFSGARYASEFDFIFGIKE